MGDIRFSCSECGTRLLADEGDAGGQAECPKCSASVVIPGEPPPPPAPQEKPYYIYKDGQQLGPFSLGQVTDMISRGQLSGTDWAWTEGMGNWKPVSMTPGIVLPQWNPGQPSSTPESSLANEFASPFQDADVPEDSGIDSLKVSESWKRIFHLIEEADGYGFHSWFIYWLKHPGALTWRERFKAGVSLWGFFFGPLYYLVKWIWAKALIYFAIEAAVDLAVIFLAVLTGYEIRSWGWYLISLPFRVSYLLLAKWDYYLRKVKKKQLW